MADNIKYIRWASKVLKIIMVINMVIGLIVFASTLLMPAAAAARGNAVGTGFGIVVNFGALVAIVVQAFITYTAARGLELLADIAYHLLVTWHKS